jgi:hypothetical protein
LQRAPLLTKKYGATATFPELLGCGAYTEVGPGVGSERGPIGTRFAAAKLAWPLSQKNNQEEDMRRLIGVWVSAAGMLVCASAVRAQDILVPAGTLLQCTMNEPNFSSKTAAVGDPVVCHLRTLQEFGRPVFPRGSMLGGHLEADKEPGHFWGKGYLRITFDRVILPNGDLPVPAKVIQIKDYKVDKKGDIDGKGHAKRDVVEWMIPPLWPWKLLMLPARGPRPTLKGEETLTMRLMEDVTIPRPGAQYNSRDYRPSASSYNSYKPAIYYNDAREIKPQVSERLNAGVVTSVDSGFGQVSQTETLLANITNTPQGTMQAAVTRIEPVVAVRTPSSALTLIALRNETIYGVASYWLDGDNLDYVLPSGARASCALNDVDLARTTQLNAERGITVSFHAVPAPPDMSLSSAVN